MASTRRYFSVEFKLAALQRMETCPNVTALAQELGVLPKCLYQWRDVVRRRGEAGLVRVGRPSRVQSQEVRRHRSAVAADEGAAAPSRIAALQSQVADLERIVGRQQAELDFFAEVFARFREKQPSSSGPLAQPFAKPSAKR